MLLYYINKSINQSIKTRTAFFVGTNNQSTNSPISKSMHDLCVSTIDRTDRPINQSTHLSIDQLTNQLTHKSISTRLSFNTVVSGPPELINQSVPTWGESAVLSVCGAVVYYPLEELQAVEELGDGGLHPGQLPPPVQDEGLQVHLQPRHFLSANSFAGFLKIVLRIFEKYFSRVFWKQFRGFLQPFFLISLACIGVNC